MSPKMGTEGAALSKTLVADFALVRLFAGMGPPMFNQILPGAERLTAKLTDLRLFASMYPDVSLHVLPRDQLAAHLARHLIFAGVGPQMLLVVIAVDGFEATDLALVLSRLGLTVNPHVTTEVNVIAEGLMADLAGARLLIGMQAHVSPQVSSQIEALVTNLAELGELLVMPSDMELQVIFGCKLRTAHGTDMRRIVQRFVHVQVSLFLENLVAFVALDRPHRRFFFLFTIFLDPRDFILRPLSLSLD